MSKQPLYPHIPKTEQRAEQLPYMTLDTVSRWPLLYLEKTRQFFIVLDLPLPNEGRSWISVIDVTDMANELKLNRGLIREGAVVFGPGEAYADVGSEGRYASAISKDGERHQYRIEQLAVDITVPKVRR